MDIGKMLGYFMDNLFNDKLYNQYYPLKTEEEKNEFLKSNKAQIYRMIRDVGSDAKNQLYGIYREYTKKMKSTVSFSGTLKYQNILHNEYFTHKMLVDRRIKIITKNILDIDSLEYRVMNHEYENITVDELNCILSLKNFKKRKMLIMCLLLTLLIICAYIFL